MVFSYDILFNICTFLNYKELICLCSTNKGYYADYEKKDSFYKKQLEIFEQYSCPLFAIDCKDYDVCEKIKRYTFKLCKFKKNKKYVDNGLKEFINFLHKNNILDIQGITPYISNQPSIGYYEFMKTDTNLRCHDFKCDILLYTDIVTKYNVFETFFDSARIVIKSYFSETQLHLSNKFIKMSNENGELVYRICWNICNIDQNINYDKNALWIPLSQIYYDVCVTINFHKDNNKLHAVLRQYNYNDDLSYFFVENIKLKITGINHEFVRVGLPYVNFIRPRLWNNEARPHFFDLYSGGDCHPGV
jgi:hypothetical protein